MALTDNLVAYYKLDGNSNDSVGSNNGTDTGVSYVSGKINNAGSYNGSTSHTAVPNNSALQLSTGSISFWFNTTSNLSSWRGLVAKQGAFGVFLNSGELTLYDWGTDLNRASGVTPSINTWHHCVLSFQSGVTNGTKLYLNGTLIFTTTITVSSQSEGVSIAAGNYAGNIQNYNGLIDEVGIWSRALSPTEVTQLYNSGAGLQYPFVFVIPPTITTTSVSHITNRNAQLNLELTSDGGATTTIGTCHSTAPNPVSTDNPYTKIAGVGTYQLDIPNLLANTKYYVRSFATNIAGTSYGAELDFTTDSEAKILLQENGRALLSNSKTIKI